jgi:hypothetical protein
MVFKGTAVFAFNLYYQGREELGTTSGWETTWLGSIKNFFGDNVIIFNPDIYGPSSSSESDSALISLLNESGASLLLMVFHNGSGWKRSFISDGALRQIQKSGVRIVAIWGDLQYPKQQSLALSLRDMVDLNLATASESVVARLSCDLPIMYSWVPIIDSPIRSSELCNCGAQVSYAGSIKENRLSTLRYLEKRGVNVHVGGGEGVKSLSRHEYLKLLAHPMTLSFSSQRGEKVVNARVFEALGQRSLLLEEWGRETAKWFIPFVEFVPWRTKSELLAQILWLGENPSTINTIARAGHEARKQLSNERLWSRVIDYLGNEVAEGVKRVTYARQDIQWGPYIRLPRNWETLANRMAGSSKLSFVWSVRRRTFEVAAWFSVRLVHGIRLVSKSSEPVLRWLGRWQK